MPAFALSWRFDLYANPKPLQENRFAASDGRSQPR